MCEKIFLRNNNPPAPDGSVFKPYLEPCLLNDGKKHAALLVLPGGGYSIRADYEGMPVAEKFRSFGMHAFVLQYRVKPYTYPAPQEDVFRAIRLIRSRAEEFRINPDKIAVLGFSAGGNLACCAGCLKDSFPDEFQGDAADSFSRMPNAEILCYSAVEFLSREKARTEKLESGMPLRELFEYDFRKLVTRETPPAFLWHTSEDQTVPVENSLNYAAELRKNGIPFEMHIFPNGRHGLGMGIDDNVPEIRVWPELAGQWLIRQGWA